jgi:hypothetical protein
MTHKNLLFQGNKYQLFLAGNCQDRHSYRWTLSKTQQNMPLTNLHTPTPVDELPREPKACFDRIFEMKGCPSPVIPTGVRIRVSVLLLVGCTCSTDFYFLYHKATWTMGELEPYLNHLVEPGLSQAQLLLKFTRSSVAIGSKDRIYSRRK